LGGTYILERSCPHILFQEKLIEEESAKLQVPYLPKPAWWIERSLQEYEEADFILAPSDYTKRTLVEKGLSESKVKRIPLDYRLSTTSRTQRAPSGEFVVGTVMGNPLRKGLIYLLEAWEQLKLPAAKLLIKMDSKLLDPFPVLKKVIQRNSSISLQGFYPDLKEFYQQCDLFILPSIDDGFGLVVNEAVGHGIPTIATSHVGAVENYRDQKFVKSLPPQNSSAIAETLEYFFENRQELEYLKREMENYLKAPPKPTSYFSGIRDLYQTLSFAKPRGFESSKIPT
jgi:glycosyltransferase involved in cell wall biosynthesis